MMWIPTTICAAFATITCMMGWQAATQPPTRIGEYIVLALVATAASAGTAIAGIEAARQSGWLP